MRWLKFNFLHVALKLAFWGRREMIFLRSVMNFQGIPEVPDPITVTYLMYVALSHNEVRLNVRLHISPIKITQV